MSFGSSVRPTQTAKDLSVRFIPWISPGEQLDSNATVVTGIPHTGFHNTKCAADSAVRESIETRIFVFYSERKYEGDNSECRKP